MKAYQGSCSGLRLTIRTLSPRIRIQLLAVGMGTAMSAATEAVWAADRLGTDCSDTGPGIGLEGHSHVPGRGLRSCLESK